MTTTERQKQAIKKYRSTENGRKVNNEYQKQFMKGRHIPIAFRREWERLSLILA